MSYRVRQKIKGKIYIYEATSFWDPETKKAKQKRKYIGVENEGGKITTPHKEIKIKSITEYGAIYLLNYLSEECKLKEVVKAVFPKKYQDIMNLVFFKVIEHEPYYLFQTWAEGTHLYEGEPLISQELTRFMEELGDDEDSQKEFFRSWVQEHKNAGTLIFDITSISSHSRYNDWLEWGYNRDGENLPQINLGAIVSQDLGIPLAYRFCPGSIPDVATLKNTVLFAKDLGISGIKFVLDKGFYSAKNIGELVRDKIGFIIPLSFTTKESQRLIKETDSELKLASNAFHHVHDLMYYVATTATVGQTELQAHVYLNVQRQKEQISALLLKLAKIEEKVAEKVAEKTLEMEKIAKYLKEEFESHAKFFLIEGGSLKRNNQTIEAETLHMGKMILVTNNTVTKQELLEIYVKKDMVEKYFDQMKNELDDRRLRVSSKNVFSGRLFITFLALILRTYLSSKSNKAKLNKQFTVPEIISHLKLIRRVATANGQCYLSEISKNQRFCFDKLNVPIPEANPAY